MNYIAERYLDNKRFNQQYEEIYRFLLDVGEQEINEHFHWGRFEWMMSHSMLDINSLDKIAVFRDDDRKIVGLVTYDTKFDGTAYILHSKNDKQLLEMMLDFVQKNYPVEENLYIAVNSKDDLLGEVLAESEYTKRYEGEGVLQISLDCSMDYQMPEGYRISPKDFEADNWKYQMVIHRGFNHEDIPEKWDDALFLPTPNYCKELKVFAVKGEEYCAHCGVWYTEKGTAYIEPVVTVPECRKTGLGKAVVYEALKRARELGAKRAIVLSKQQFYYKIGFELSSEVTYWTKEKKLERQ